MTTQAAPAEPTLKLRPARPVMGELLEFLAGMHAQLKELLALTHAKLAAIRQADGAALTRLAIREGELVRDTLIAEQQRAAVLARFAQSLPGGPPPQLTVTALADALPEPESSVLRARGVALREVAEELQRKNAVVAAVARNLQEHIRGVFAELARATQDNVVYGAGGRHEAGSRRCWVDAVG